MLFSAGNHNIDGYDFNFSVYRLSQNASVDPNVKSNDPMTRPELNEARKQNETTFLGSHCGGKINAKALDAQTIVLYGVTSSNIRFTDFRTDV